VDEGGGDVLPVLSAGEEPGCRVLDILEPVRGFAGDPELLQPYTFCQNAVVHCLLM